MASLTGERVTAFCGIGNPAAFRRQLVDCGAAVAEFREFADHHDYSHSDIESLSAWLRGQDVSSVACTRKDLVKLPVDRLGTTPLWG